LRYDNAALKTFPQRWGVAKTKILGYVLLVIYVVLEFARLGGGDQFIFVKLFVGVLLFLAIKNARIEAPKYYASFWVEGIPILYCALLALMES